MQIQVAKLYYIKGSEQFLKSQVFFYVSDVWLEELIEFWRDLMLAHDISKLALPFLRRILLRFEEEKSEKSLVDFVRRIQKGNLFIFKLHEVLLLKLGAFSALRNLE